MPLSYEIEDDPCGKCVQLKGEVSVDSVTKIVPRLRRELRPATRVIVDRTAADVTTASADGLRQFHDALKLDVKRSVYVSNRSWVRGMLLSVVRPDEQSKPMATLSQARSWLSLEEKRVEGANERTEEALDVLDKVNRSMNEIARLMDYWK